ncbi:MAG: pentapeptide repeat-containing protein [Chloroflexi bacterium]|nr:pentapeptide repeat-containing protein [Chloroflexota bacterium]MCI0841384.1 pentapeptide repeat-containing protein [Chloroflexota bacterium]
MISRALLLVALTLAVALPIALAILVKEGLIPFGFKGKSLWDMLEVFVLPIVVVVIAGLIAFWARRSSRRAEEELSLARDQAREASLGDYLEFISGLIVDGKLGNPQLNDDAMGVASARTLATLRTLDGSRKGLLIQFLSDPELILINKRVISLRTADLRELILFRGSLQRVDLADARLENAILAETNLSSAILHSADLRNADLREADLKRADLSDADLRGSLLHYAELDEANLSESDLTGAELREASLHGANLFEADLSNADLRGADLSYTSLRSADLSNADLLGIDLSNADLSNAKVANSQLRWADQLTGAIMPDGSTMTKDNWNSFKDSSRFWARMDREYRRIRKLFVRH